MLRDTQLARDVRHCQFRLAVQPVLAEQGLQWLHQAVSHRLGRWNGDSTSWSEQVRRWPANKCQERSHRETRQRCCIQQVKGGRRRSPAKAQLGNPDGEYIEHGPAHQNRAQHPSLFDQIVTMATPDCPGCRDTEADGSKGQKKKKR